MLRIKNAANVAISLRSNSRISFSRATAIQPTIVPTAALTYAPIVPALRFRALRIRASGPESIPSSLAKFLQAHKDGIHRSIPGTIPCAKQPTLISS
jgi:hypothetical protein